MLSQMVLRTLSVGAQHQLAQRCTGQSWMAHGVGPTPCASGAAPRSMASSWMAPFEPLKETVHHLNAEQEAV